MTGHVVGSSLSFVGESWVGANDAAVSTTDTTAQVVKIGPKGQIAGAGTTMTLTLTGFTAGNTLVAVMAWNEAGGDAIPNSIGGMTATQAAIATFSTTKSAIVYYESNVSAGDKSVTVVGPSNATWGNGNLIELSGVKASPIVNAAGTSTGTDARPVSGKSGIITEKGIAIAVLCCGGNNAAVGIDRPEWYINAGIEQDSNSSIGYSADYRKINSEWIGQKAEAMWGVLTGTEEYAGTVVIFAEAAGGIVTTASDTRTFSDSAVASLSHAAVAADTRTFSDSAVATTVRTAVAADTRTFSDSAVASLSHTAVATDTRTFSDSAVAARAQAAVAVDSVAFSDSAVSSLSHTAVAADTRTFSDSAIASVVLAAITAVAADTVVFSDAATAAKVPGFVPAIFHGGLPKPRRGGKRYKKEEEVENSRNKIREELVAVIAALYPQPARIAPPANPLAADLPVVGPQVYAALAEVRDLIVARADADKVTRAIEKAKVEAKARLRRRREEELLLLME